MNQVSRRNWRQGIGYLMLFGANLVLLVAIGFWSLAKEAPVFGPPGGGWQWPKLPGLLIATLLLPILFGIFNGFQSAKEKESAVAWLFWTFTPCFSVGFFFALGAWLLPAIIPWTWPGILALLGTLCLYEILALVLTLPKDY